MDAEVEFRGAAEELKRKEEELAAREEAEKADAKRVVEADRRQPRKYCEEPPREPLEGRNARMKEGSSRQRHPPSKLRRRREKPP